MKKSNKKEIRIKYGNYMAADLGGGLSSLKGILIFLGCFLGFLGVCSIGERYSRYIKHIHTAAEGVIPSRTLAGLIWLVSPVK